ncbi:SDR family NAD(P)-dependent oxidoreductase [Massilia sp. METH4]|uniref:type I polyketide synthase n=1 Tax=Massilia sp. METH4 TaxID=3123041 RepID=UPI0030D5CE87
MKEKEYSGKIAIIGISGRFPGAPDVESFWNMLCESRSALRHFTPEEIRAGIDAHDYLTAPFVERQVAAGGWVGAGYHLPDVDKFDAGFFGYSPSEAELIDPQQRLFLEASWAAMEDAGYPPDGYHGVAAVYAGTGLSRYFLNNVYANREIMCASDRDLIAGIGNEPDYLSNRVAYKLNLTGPSVTVQTACSTSLVAIHMACQALRAGECDLSLAGGSMATVPAGLGYNYTEGSLNSDDGRIRAFDAGAKGTVFSEGGVGVIVLKRLEDAQADDDNIYAVIRGSAVTNDGSHKAGYTAPGIDGQVDAITRALKAARTNPEEIGYIEAHGTGTSLGDPIEITALTRAFRAHTGRTGYCAIGSVKTNVGHLAPAAGVAGVIKAALAARTGVLPPSLHFDTPNPRIDFPGSPFFVNDRLNDWQTAPLAKRVAAVSSFGIGGTNAHLILEEPPVTKPTRSGEKPRIFPLSAKSPGALGRMAGQLARFLERHPATDLDDVAFTLQEGRRAFDLRTAVVAGNTPELIAALDKVAKEPNKTAALPATKKLALLFTGQGSQFAGMARELHAQFPVFRDTFDACCATLARHVDTDLARLLLTDAPVEADHALLRETRHAQPALFTVEYALAMQLLAWKIEPAALLGHSLGEYVAATVAGVFTQDDALRLVALRGRLMQAMPPGGMLSIGGGAAEARRFLGGEIELAAVNSPRASVVSGPLEAIATLEADLDAAGIGCRKLQTSHAFHSAMMRPLAAEFRAAVAAAAPRSPALPVVSNVTGTWLTAAEATDPDYWVRHLLSPVLFQAGVETLVADGCGFFVEAGPSGVLSTFVRHTVGTAAGKPVAVAVPLMRHPQDAMAGDRFLLAALGNLWAAGHALDYADVDADNLGRRISLPTYPFARERHWVEPPPAPSALVEATLRRSEDLGEWFHAASWRRQPWLEAVPALAGRKVLLLAHDDEQGNALAAALRKAGAAVACAEPGPAFGVVDEDAYWVRPDQAADWEALARHAGKPDAIVHAWLLPASGGDTVTNSGATLELGFHALLALTQAFGDDTAARLPLLSVASEVFDVQPGETVDAVKTTMLGAHLAIGYEHRGIASRVLDVPAACRDAATLVLDELARLDAEPHAPAGPADQFVAERAGARWLAHVETMAVPEPAVPAALAADGTYIVTGGLGGLGLEFADVLVERGARHLVLVGRNVLPPQAEWHAWLAANPDDTAGRDRIRRLQRMAGRGVQVVTERCDITDPAAVQAMVERVQADMPPVRGVVHAAGIAGAGVMALKTRAQADAVLAPKVKGALALEAALAGQPLDFFVAVSSLFGTIGGIGQADYAAANAFLDAFARSRSARGRRTLSLAYGGWREVGMAVAMGHTASAPVLPAGRTLAHPYLFSRADEAGALRFTTHLRAQDHWALQDHRIQGTPVMPGTALIETVRAAFQEATGSDGACTLSDVFFYRPLFVPADRMVTVDVLLQPVADGYAVEVKEGESPVLTATVAAGAAAARHIDLASIAEQCRADVLEFPGGAAAMVGEQGFLDLGRHWQVVRRIRLGGRQLLGELALPEGVDDDAALGLHPALLDMATGPITGHLLARLDLGLEDEYLPFTYGALEVHGRLGTQLYSHVTFGGISDDRDVIRFDIALAAPDGNVLAEVKDFRLRRVPAGSFAAKPAAAPAVDDGSISPQEGRALFARALALRHGGHWILNPHPVDALLRKLRADRIAPAAAPAEKKKVVREDVVAAPPTNPTEEVLVAIIEGALGITPVGIHDNFFDLGIDSVIGIQVVSHARKHGVLLKPNQLFEHQTVAELAAVAGAANDAAPATAPAPAPSTPEPATDNLDAVLHALAD